MFEIRTLTTKFTPKLNVIKYAKGETLTDNDDILATWKQHCEGLFTKYGSTVIYLLHKLIVKIWQPLFTCFVDYTKAFATVEHQQLWSVMREMGFPKRIVSLIEALYREHNLQSD